MADFVDEAIVLRRVNYAESDRILTLLTREHGKIGAIARGVRKPRSRLAANTDLFARSRMQFARGRGELSVLTQAQRVGSLPAAAEPLPLACAAVCTELTDRVIEEHHPDPEIFEMLAAALADILGNVRDPRAVVAWFARRMIDRLGYAPQLESCAACGRTLPEAPAIFNGDAGGLLCDDCARLTHGGIACSVRVIKVLRLISRGDGEVYWRLRLDEADLSTLEAVVERELEVNLERRLRSLDVLRALRSS